MNSQIIFGQDNNTLPEPVNKPVTINYVPEQPVEDSNLNQSIRRFIGKYLSAVKGAKNEYTPIHVDEIASKIAKFYELVRKVIDWKEDNQLRRGATERILKRILFPKVSGIAPVIDINTHSLAESVVTELIRGGHLPNDEIPQEKIDLVAKAFHKYRYFLANAPYNSGDLMILKTRINFFTFIIELAAAEIEEILTDPIKEDGLIMAMYEEMYHRIRISPPESLNEATKKAQVYIAVCRTLFDLDNAYINYHLLKFRFDPWLDPDQDRLKEINGKILNIWRDLEAELEHPLSKEFYNLCERVDTVFSLLSDFVDKYKESPNLIRSKIENREEFKNELTEFYNKRFNTLKQRLFRLAVFSTLSVFVSNWFTFYIIEVPLAALFYEGFNIFTAFIDFLIPTLLMFIMVSIIRPPGKDNLNKVLKLSYSFIYASEKKDLYEIKVNRRTRPTFIMIVSIIYTLGTLLSFGIIGYIFYIAELPLTSVIFDTFTIALTVFAAVLIRNRSKELSVDDKTSVWEFVLDMLSVPLAKTGSFFASKWKEYNIVAIFFTFFIETPFVLILDFIEQWSQFLRDRKAELH